MILLACDEPPSPPPPDFSGVATLPPLPAGGSAGQIPTPIPERDWTWQPCGEIAAAQDPAIAVVPIGETAALVSYASGREELERPRKDALVLSSAGDDLEATAVSPHGTFGVRRIGSSLELRSLGSLGSGQVLSSVVLPASCVGRPRFGGDEEHVLLPASGGGCCVVEPQSHRVSVFAVARPNLVDCAFDGDELVALSKDGLLSAQNEAGELSASVQLPVLPADQLLLSPRGDRVVVEGSGQASLFGASGELLAHGEAARHVTVFSANGEFVLLGPRVLRSDTGEEVATLPWNAFAVAIDGKRVAVWDSRTDEPHPFLWDVEAGEQRGAFGGHTWSVLDVGVSPDGSSFTSSSGYSLLAWRIAEPFQASRPRWTADLGLEMFSRYSADGSLLAISGDGRGLYSSSGRAVFRPAPPLSVASGYYATFALSPDGRYLVGGSYDTVMDVLDAVTLATVAELPVGYPSLTAAFTADGAWLITSEPELYRTGDWALQWSSRGQTPPGGDRIMSDVLILPGERDIVVSHCAGVNSGLRHAECEHRLWSIGGESSAVLLTTSRGAHPSVHASSGWLVAGGSLIHLTTRSQRFLGEDVDAAAFLPNGDIVAGTSKGELRRYCRDPR